jgi:hypothetical protein
MKTLKKTLAPFLDIIIFWIIALTLSWFLQSCASVDPAARYQKAHKDNVFKGYKKIK